MVAAPLSAPAQPDQVASAMTSGLPEEAPPPYSPPLPRDAETRFREFQQQVREVASFIRTNPRLHQAVPADNCQSSSTTGTQPPQSPASAGIVNGSPCQTYYVDRSGNALTPQQYRRQQASQAQRQGQSVTTRPQNRPSQPMGPSIGRSTDTATIVQVNVKAGTTIRGSGNVVSLGRIQISPEALGSMAVSRPECSSPIQIDMTIDIEGDNNRIFYNDVSELSSTVDLPQKAHKPAAHSSGASEGEASSSSAPSGPSTETSPNNRTRKRPAPAEEGQDDIDVDHHAKASRNE